MKYYILEIHEDYPGEFIFMDTEELLNFVNDAEFDEENDHSFKERDERFVDPYIVLSRGESIEIKDECYALSHKDAIKDLDYIPTISTTNHCIKEQPNLVFDKFKDAFSNDDRFNHIKYHKVRVTTDINLYRLVVPSIDKEKVFDFDKTTVEGGNIISNEHRELFGYSEYFLEVEKFCRVFRNPVFREENLIGLHAFKLRYDTDRIFVDEVFKEFCEQNGFDDIGFFDIDEYGYC